MPTNNSTHLMAASTIYDEKQNQGHILHTSTGTFSAFMHSAVYAEKEIQLTGKAGFTTEAHMTESLCKDKQKVHLVLSPVLLSV